METFRARTYRVNKVKSVLNRTAQGLLRVVPDKVARHLLFLAQNQTDTLDRWGYHIRPIHFYEPLPDFRSISEEQINRQREYAAINFHFAEQIKLLMELAAYRNELQALNPNSSQNGFDFRNGYFAGFDAAVYYSIIRRLKPRRIIEIGGGYSTRIAHLALSRNRIHDERSELICIEPNPEPRLLDAKLDIELIEKPVQEIGTKLFSELEANDILFIDSSHSVKFNSDVCYELLDILPKLKPGVWVHIHDIFFPYDYPAEWLMRKRMALNEQYLLEAFLSFNSQFIVRLSNHWIALEHRELATNIWPMVDGEIHGASSFWMERTR